MALPFTVRYRLRVDALKIGDLPNLILKLETRTDFSVVEALMMHNLCCAFYGLRYKNVMCTRTSVTNKCSNVGGYLPIP